MTTMNPTTKKDLNRICKLLYKSMNEEYGGNGNLDENEAYELMNMNTQLKADPTYIDTLHESVYHGGLSGKDIRQLTQYIDEDFTRENYAVAFATEPDDEGEGYQSL